MAEISNVLARLRREPLADLHLADRLDQLMAQSGHEWRDRLLPPLVTLRLFLVQVLNGNVAIAALRHLLVCNSPSQVTARREVDCLCMYCNRCCNGCTIRPRSRWGW